MRQLFASAAITAASTFLFANSALAQSPQLTAAQYQGCYSSSDPLTTNSSLTYQFQSTGWCQEQCGKFLQKAVFGLSKGSDCYCGDKLPANSTKVPDSECNVPCQGFGQQDCGGRSTFSVFTSGLSSNVDSNDDDSSPSSSSAATASDNNALHAQTQAPSTITQAGKTIVVTATSSATGSAQSSPSSGGGPNKAAIAAGTVVGVIAIAAIAGGILFMVRHRRRRAIEEEHRREQAKSNFAYSGTIKSTSEGSDSRLDPSLAFRRQSDGSIADERDFTRRVLQVTNPDRP